MPLSALGSPTLADIEAAAAVLDGVARKTPLIHSKTFSARTGCRVYFKLENLQGTGSFKLRGAYYKIHTLTAAERARGVVCASAGNHAQGVAFAAAEMGVACTVFMPLFAPPSKIQATRGYGARVERVGMAYDDAYAAACTFAETHGATFVHAFDDPTVMAGQGTIGLEILADLPEVDAVLCPIGGGGLIAGVARAMKHHKPEVKIIGVEAEGAPAMQRSLEAGRIVPATSLTTIADGIAVKVPGSHTFPFVQALVDTVVTVPDSETALALYLLMQRAKLLTEPAGVIGLAALLSGQLPCPGAHVVVVLSGGNVDLALLAQIIERGLLHEGLLAKLTVAVPDKPGTLDALLRILADVQANVEDVTHDRFAADVPIGHARVTVTFRTLGREQIGAVEQALAEQGLVFAIVA